MQNIFLSGEKQQEKKKKKKQKRNKMFLSNQLENQYYKTFLKSTTQAMPISLHSDVIISPVPVIPVHCSLFICITLHE